jgi:hypothetical protein
MKKVIMSLTVALAGLFGTTSANATVLFSDNFESSGPADAQLKAPWEMNKQVFTSTGAYVGGYYPGTTFGPNAIVAGGAAGSAFSAKVWPDYGYAPDWANGNTVAVGLLVSKVGLTAQDIAPGVIQFDFDYLRDPNPGANAKAYGFVKLLSPGWDQTWAFNTFNLAASGDWLHGSVSMGFDGTQVGANFQWGVVVSDASYTGGAGLKLDNVVVASVPEPSVASLLGFGVLGLVATRFRRRS